MYRAYSLTQHPNAGDSPQENIRNQSHQRYDILFSRLMDHQEIVQSLLQWFLPQKILKFLNLQQITHMPTTFVNNAQQSLRADRVFEVSLQGQPGNLLILWEHQSHPNPWMSLRILDYTVALWRFHRTKKPKEPLPIVLPLVLAHGPRPWTHVPRNVRKLLHPPAKELLSVSPWARFFLMNLNRYSVRTLCQDPWLAAGALTLQRSHLRSDRDFILMMRAISHFL